MEFTLRIYDDKLIKQDSSIANQEASLPKPDIASDVDVPPSSPIKAAITEPPSDEHIKTEQLSFDISSTIPTKNEPDDTVTLDLNEYDDPDYYEQQQIADQELQEQNEYSNISIEAAEETQEVNENIQAAEVESVPEEANLETVVAEIGEKEKGAVAIRKAAAQKICKKITTGL